VDDITIRWKDPASAIVHSVELHGITVGSLVRPARYTRAETGCGVRLSVPIDPTDEPIDCDGCISRNGDDALREVERILARDSMWRTAPARKAVTA